MAGVKFDQQKPKLAMLSRYALEEEAKVMQFGANKYGKWNYLEGMLWSRLLDAALRHIYAFSEGNSNDDETGLSHLAHARCCLGFLLEYIEKGLGDDDRKDTNEKDYLKSSTDVVSKPAYDVPSYRYYDPASGVYYKTWDELNRQSLLSKDRGRKGCGNPEPESTAEQLKVAVSSASESTASGRDQEPVYCDKKSV